MTSEKATALASLLGGEVARLMPQSRTPGVRLLLPNGRVAFIDESGGETYHGPGDVRAYATDGDADGHIAESAEWASWGISEDWATGLARLIGGEAYQSGGNIWVVLFPRPDGRFIVVGDDGAEIYDSAEHYERYYDENRPEPAFVYWSDSEARA